MVFSEASRYKYYVRREKMEVTWELLNDYKLLITSKETKMNAYQQMKLQDAINGLEIGPASEIFELETDDFTKPYQVKLLKQLEKKYELTAAQKEIFDKFIEENSKPRRKRMKPIFWAWTYKIYNGQKMMISNNEYCGYLRSFYSKEEREDECNFTKDAQVGPLTITLKTEPITAADAYKALINENGVNEIYLYRKYMLETQDERQLSLSELLRIWRGSCTDLKF